MFLGDVATRLNNSRRTISLKWQVTATTAGKRRKSCPAGGSGKRYKTSEMLRFIFATIAYDPDPDLTPLAVRRLCQALFGRTGSQWLIVEIFGVKGRQHRSDDSTPESVEKWQPDIVTPQGCTGRQLWRKLSG